MSLWMGNVDIENMPQRRFARSFFPHRLCNAREIHVLPAKDPVVFDYLFKNFPLVQDIALVRTWEPFVLNQAVKLVPMKLGDDMLKFHRKVMKEMHACLMTGFGQTEEKRWVPQFLRYNFRHILCTTNCHESHKSQIFSACDICSSSIARPDKGIKIAKPARGDSGSPLVCYDGETQILIGVHSRYQQPHDVKRVNATNAIATSVACIRESLTSENLQSLRDADNTVVKTWPRLDDIPMGPFQENNE
ncbi:hypothetical protein GE061_018532 [Apolygus lucorum]|uniref:Peptidase S1 domain-containing protein n=1 Tax=Apolygus lucorum TaxID=248454 RepID=A0A8S9XG70_APOLU|nr:hypothetical protein GE061_018532 [Apolygus lucorum]